MINSLLNKNVSVFRFFQLILIGKTYLSGGELATVVLSREGDTKAEGPFEVAKKIKEELDFFKEKVPVLTALCNKGLKDRHWEKISAIVGFQIEPDNSWTLTRLMDMDIEKFVKDLEDISESASKEFQIEKSLDTQEEEWAPIIAEFKPWKDTGTYIYVFLKML